MKYEHRFRVKASLPAVNTFHRLAASLSAITPPPIRVKVHRAPAELSDGQEIDFTLCLGPFCLPWLARIESVTDAEFTDRQLRGPFESWLHRHSFRRINENITEVTDQIDIQLKRSPGARLLGLGFVLGLPFLFAFRGWKTRALLEK